jgi:dTDP-4-dehydrorhamnose reductase
MMRILVTGRSGQLAVALAERATERPEMELIFLGRPEFDMEQTASIVEHIESWRPDLVINAAAYTAVDLAETEPGSAFAINRDGAAAAARAADRLGVPFVHISTDYVFDGRKAQPYVEVDETYPLNVYGRSKLEGERAVLEAHSKAVILRTSWIFSPFGSNFLKTMLKVGAERPVLRVVGDQVGNPTSALDLAKAILDISPALRGEPGGLYHLTGEGSTSWHGFADFIFQESARRGGPAPALEAISSADYKTAAVRPANSRLASTAFANRFGVKLRPWTEAASETLARCLSG